MYLLLKFFIDNVSHLACGVCRRKLLKVGFIGTFDTV